MTSHVSIKPKIFEWTRERAGLSVENLAKKFPKYPDWEKGQTQPTFRQIKDLAKHVHAPEGYFFLSEPLDETLQLPDFRTVGNEPVQRPTPDLLDTIRLCRLRQEWYRDFARIEGGGPLPFVGAASMSDGTETVAAGIRKSLELDYGKHMYTGNRTDSFHEIVEKADAIGVLVMVSSVVRNNAHRRLKPEEFKSFTLADEFAPLVFINGADNQAVQVFTLAHELAHVWLGESALSNSCPNSLPENEIEIWCNKVAAEILVPLDALREEYRKDEALYDGISRLTRLFRVSTLIMLRRIYDLGMLTQEQFHNEYDAELRRQRKNYFNGNGNGDFMTTLTARIGKRFAQALIIDTLEGKTLLRDALWMLGITRADTFRKFATQLGINHGLPS